jgi:hypothetical protein
LEAFDEGVAFRVTLGTGGGILDSAIDVEGGAVTISYKTGVKGQGECWPGGNRWVKALSGDSIPFDSPNEVVEGLCIREGFCK